MLLIRTHVPYLSMRGEPSSLLTWNLSPVRKSLNEEGTEPEEGVVAEEPLAAVAIKRTAPAKMINAIDMIQSTNKKA